MKSWNVLSIVLAILWLGLVLTPSQAQSGLAQLTITDIDHSSYPQVNVQVRATNDSGKPITGLSANSLQVTEDGTPQTIALSTTTGGIYIHYVIDAGPAMYGERWQRARDAILNFVTTDPRLTEDDLIEISVMEPAGSRQIVPPTNNKDTIVQVITDYRPPASSDTSYGAPLNFIGSWADALVGNRQVEGRPTIIVVLTANFGTTTRTADVAGKAKAANTPIYTFLVREQPNGESTYVSQLASQSGGEYIHVQSVASLVPAYNSIEQYRQQYLLSYDSRGSLSGARRVEVRGDNTSVQANGSYNIQIQPPKVTIVLPVADQAIARVANEFVPEEQWDLIEPTEQLVRATIEFPDGYPRRLNEAALFVNGNLVASATGTRELEFVWNLRQGQTLGSTTYELVVAVEDVLGLIATSEIKSKVELYIPPVGIEPIDIQATIEAMGISTTPVTITTVITQVVPIVTTCSFVESQGWTRGCTVERFVRDDWASIVAVAVSLGAVAFVATSKSAPAQNIRNTVRHAVERVTNRYRKQAVRAYLVVEDGDPALAGQRLEVYGDTPIGRSLEVASLIFHAAQANTPISRLHCTLLDKEDHFEIQDEDSANGTIVNGRRLRPLEPQAIQDGDIIELAPVARGGVRLRFQLALGGDVYDETQSDIRHTQRSRTDDAF